MENRIMNGVEDEDSDDSSGGYEPMEESDLRVLCLFCEHTSSTVEDSIQHCIDAHGFNIYSLRDKFELDYYSYIKLINYIRTTKPNPKDLDGLEVMVWSGEEYLKPHDVNDPWLWHDLEGLRSGEDRSAFPPNYVNSENGSVTMAQDHFTDILNTMKNLNEQVQEKEALITKLKDVITCINQKIPVSVAKSNDGDGYFNSYSGSHIHWEMLSDTIRTGAYKSAIENNSSVFLGKTVLDVGCGTGILSLMSASAGAEKVVAVDHSDILYKAVEIAKENEMLGKIEFVKGRLEEAVLPDRKYDIIISEWMGYFLLFEGMLSSIIYARKNFLSSDGIMLPSSCGIYLVGASDAERHESIFDFWSDVYGYKMTAMVNLTMKEACVEQVKEEDIITTPFKVHSIDMNSVTEENAYFESDFKLTATQDGSLTEIVGYFDVLFNLPRPEEFTTSPSAPPTHWKQTVFYIKEPIELKKGDCVDGHINCYRLPSELRSLQVDLTINGKQQSYFLS